MENWWLEIINKKTKIWQVNWTEDVELNRINFTVAKFNNKNVTFPFWLLQLFFYNISFSITIWKNCVKVKKTLNQRITYYRCYQFYYFFKTVSGKNPLEKSLNGGVRGRFRVRLRIGLGLEFGGFFPGGGFFRKTL